MNRTERKTLPRQKQSDGMKRAEVLTRRAVVLSCLHVTAVGLLLACAMPVQATEAAWARLATGGYTILMRHAQAPGSGDPPGFDINDCATQRNLSDRGRQQAGRVGVRFAARAVTISAVYSSRLCRALDTARYAFRTPSAEPLPALDPLPEDPAERAAMIDQVLDIIRSFRGPGNQVMVTHQDNITALTGVELRAGEVLIVTPEEGSEYGLKIVARLLLH